MERKIWFWFLVGLGLVLEGLGFVLVVWVSWLVWFGFGGFWFGGWFCFGFCGFEVGLVLFGFGGWFGFGGFGFCFGGWLVWFWWVWVWWLVWLGLFGLVCLVWYLLGPRMDS